MSEIYELAKELSQIDGPVTIKVFPTGLVAVFTVKSVEQSRSSLIMEDDEAKAIDALKIVIEKRTAENGI